MIDANTDSNDAPRVLAAKRWIALSLWLIIVASIIAWAVPVFRFGFSTQSIPGTLYFVFWISWAIYLHIRWRRGTSIGALIAFLSLYSFMIGLGLLLVVLFAGGPNTDLATSLGMVVVLCAVISGWIAFFAWYVQSKNGLKRLS